MPTAAEILFIPIGVLVTHRTKEKKSEIFTTAQ